MARIRHPNIVRRYELRRLHGGHVALVMQYVRGESLITILRRRGKLRFDETVQILRDIGLALEHAHANGVIHRDVKPHNILIDADNGSALLSDFGIAKATQGDAEVTATGMAIGTPAYMAPEMVHGEGELDGRTDLYSLGCVAYYLLTGELVFAGETALQTALLHVQQQPVPPSERTGNPIPPMLERLVLACLAKHPADRPQSASDLGAALAALNGPTASG